MVSIDRRERFPACFIVPWRCLKNKGVCRTEFFEEGGEARSINYLDLLQVKNEVSISDFSLPAVAQLTSIKWLIKMNIPLRSLKE